MENLRIVKCFIKDRAFEASDGRLYYVKAEDGKLQIYSKRFEVVVHTVTDDGNKEESAHWRLEDNKIFFKSKNGLVEIPKQFSNPARDYIPKPLIACDLAFFVRHPRFVYCPPDGDYEHDYIVLKAKGDGTYEDISGQFKENQYWYIRYVGICNSHVVIRAKMDSRDYHEKEFEIKLNPTEFSRLEYEKEKKVFTNDKFLQEEHDMLQEMFKHLL